MQRCGESGPWLCRPAATSRQGSQAFSQRTRPREFAHGRGMRRCRYRGQTKAHLQHVLTAIAVNIERLSRQSSDGPAPPRPPTAFQNHLDRHGVPRLRSWRAAS
ncbi:transposase [Streptomyces sp. NPDC000618]|uniref:transposase n=1 Tax=Streptomyces sp. NPDC000618 TaxID=3154265 RepID=UPI003332218F